MNIVAFLQPRWYSIAAEIEQEKLDELAKPEAKHNVKQELTNAILAAYKTGKAERERAVQVKRRSGFVGDALRAIARFFGRDWEERDHLRGKGGKFVSKGSGTAGSTGETETVNGGSEPPMAKPVDFTESIRKNKPEQMKMAEKSIDNGTQTAHNETGAAKPTFTRTVARKFRETFHAAKAAVAKLRPEDAWRVDSSYTDEDYEHMDCYTKPGRSAVAVHDGDIVSVCKHPDDNTVRGSDLLAHARAQGGNKLDAFGGLYGFYIRNGFEPVSWCPFADVKGIRPDDWMRGRDHKEPVIFFKYTGRSYDEISKQYGERKSQFVRRVKKSDGYDAAKKARDDSMNGG